jgi:fatty acid desaturase
MHRSLTVRVSTTVQLFRAPPVQGLQTELRPSALISLSDPTSTHLPRNAFERFLTRALFDPRDVVFVTLTLKLYAIFLPLWALLWWSFHWALLGVYMALALWFVSPAILMLHNTMHRPFFRKTWLTRAHAYSMSFLFGVPTGYLEHHIGMHHVENNGRDDASATIRFERDNFFHWLRYTGRFLLLIQYDLCRYLFLKRRNRLAWRALVAEWTYLAVIAAVTWHDWRLGVFIGLALFLIVRLAMMVGNWGQHAFVDPTRPLDNYANSISCVNSLYNRRCFNDGYHIGHHVKPNRHWTEMPGDLLANLDRYAREQCIVFERIDFFMVSLLLFAKRYDILARQMVTLPGDARTLAEKADFLRARTRPLAA